MKINKEFYNDIKGALKKLKEMFGDDFVVFGSAPLYLLEVLKYEKEINDLDIAILDKSKIPKDVEKVTFQGDKTKIFYKYVIDGMSIDIASQWEGQEEFFKKLFSDPIVLDGYRFVNLEVIEEWKREMVDKYNREKDKRYLEKLEDFKIKKSRQAAN